VGGSDELFCDVVLQIRELDVQLHQQLETTCVVRPDADTCRRSA
jgi:hypothetical protein